VRLDKEAGITSHDAVDRLRRVAGTRRVGHAGTLDPFATGLLLLAWGRATRLLPFLSGAAKTYDAVLQLGVVTDTGDPKGNVVARVTPPDEAFDPAVIEAAAAGFRGPIEQRAPAYSAIKQGGEPLHRKARRGEVVEPPVRTVTIHALTIGAIDRAAGTIAFSATCSSGTYIRSLAEDLGKALGPGASLVSLRRSAIGPHSVEGAIPTQDLLDRPVGSIPEWNERLTEAGLTPEDALAFLPAFALDPSEAARLAQGQAPRAGDLRHAGLADDIAVLRLTDGQGALLAVAAGAGDAPDGRPVDLKLVWAAAETADAS
jgi:tRNA pseudouridine55 synthase